MPTVAHKQCGGCTNPMTKAHAVIDGKALCATCYSHVPLKACSSCGKNTRLADNEGKPLCKACRNIGRRCARCNKSLEEHGTGLITEEGAFCSPCAVTKREPRPCPRCGKSSRRLSRDSKRGFTEQAVCEACRREGNITCSACRKDRTLFAVTKEGKPLCKPCAARGEKPFICPKCNQPGQYHSKTQCTVCYAKEFATRNCTELWEAFRHDWAKSAAKTVLQEMSFTVADHVTAKRVEHALGFIQKLDERFPDPRQIGLIELVDVIGRDGFRRYRNAFTILTEQRIIPTYTKEEIDDVAECVRHQGYIEEIGDLWCRPVIDRYYAYLLDIHARFEKFRRGKQKKRFVMNTLTSYLNAAKQFLLWLPDEVHDIRSVTQEMVNGFSAYRHGLNGSMFRFIRYLNKQEKLFTSLVPCHTEGMSPSHFLLSNGTYKRLLRTWTSPTEDNVRWCLIGLFMLLCCQSKKKVSEMKLDQITFDAKTNTYSVKFGRTPTEMIDRVGAVITLWLKERKTLSRFDDLDNNPYLFPGKVRGQHLTAAAIDHYMKREKLSSQEVFSTGVYKIILYGVRSPKSLIETYGMARPTAMKYWQEFDPKAANDVNRVRERERNGLPPL